MPRYASTHWLPNDRFADALLWSATPNLRLLWADHVDPAVAFVEVGEPPFASGGTNVRSVLQ